MASNNKRKSGAQTSKNKNSGKPQASSKSKDAQKSDAPSGSRRELMRQRQEKQNRERRIRTIVTASVVGVVALVLVGVIAFVVVPQLGSTTARGGSDSQYVVKVGDENAPVVIDIYQDYICPYCGNFERTNSDDIASMVDEGTARVQIHPLAFLDDTSNGAMYSSRSANAFVTVANLEPDKTLAFNSILMENQPDEGTTGLTDAQIAEFAQQVGISASTTDRFVDAEYADWVESATQDAFNNEGIESTPTVWINGETFSGEDLFTPGALKEAVANATEV